MGSGFDSEVETFYRSVLNRRGWGEVGNAIQGHEIRPSVDEVSQALSIYGWTILPYLPAETEDVLLQRTAEEEQTRKDDEKVDVIFQDGRLVDRTTIGFDPAKILKDRQKKKRAETGSSDRGLDG